MWHIQHLQSDPIHHLLTREHLARGLWRRSHVNLAGNLAGEVTHVRAAMAPQNASTASRRRRTSPPAPVCDAQSASSGSSRIPRNQNTVDAPTPLGPVLSTRARIARIEMLCANNSKEKENGTKDSVLVLAHRHVVCCCSCAARPRMLRKCHAGVCVCVWMSI